MPYRRDVFTPGAYYHIYNRGAAKNLIFFNPGNYEHCLRLVKRYAKPYGAAVIAYCLMPNHYHLCLRQETEIPLSRFINVVFNAYVQAVNRQQARTGALFEGRFRHVRISDDRQLIQLCRYIHRNPLEARLARHPQDWLYSNYLEWIGQRSESLKDAALITGYFATPEEYSHFVSDEAWDEKLEASIRTIVWD